MHIAVIGAGVLGVTSAWYLSRAGHTVTVIDRADGVADETSFANGGLLHASHAEPWNAPGVVWQLLRWLGREDSPLLLRPAQIPRLARWGVNFLRFSSPRHFDRATRTNARLAVYSLAAIRELRQQTGIRYADRQAGIIKIFRDQQSLDKALHASRLMDEMGVRYSALDGRRAVALEPSLGDIAHELTGAIFYPDDESGDAHLFTRELGRLCGEAGVEFRLRTTVRQLLRNGDSLTGLDTDNGVIRADCYVLAAGSYSAPLGRQAGLYLPIYPVKGYSLTAPAQGWRNQPQIPLIDDANKVVLAVLDDRIRMAGTAEFAGFDTSLRQHRADGVLRQVVKTFPSLEEHLDRNALTPWCGLRPITTDGVPILGPSPLRNLYLNCGPGHLGWTFACGLGKVLAATISDEAPDIPAAELRLDRFG
ncbi:MAG: D-amino acid dehydrogenase [Ectothiorhodospiraceae bacterium]|nr:D-amino acid dehydrogenase [Ectothiorhodospiraceae bacterium]MCH8504589.1 D-amino acid dehydrogenase [Ectothiorhodospiraceae bacterium]